MNVQLKIEFETLIELAKQLPPEAKQALIKELDTEAQDQLSSEAWKAQFNSLVVKNRVSQEFSMRREDWYGDDGR